MPGMKGSYQKGTTQAQRVARAKAQEKARGRRATARATATPKKVPVAPTFDKSKVQSTKGLGALAAANRAKRAKKKKN